MSLQSTTSRQVQSLTSLHPSYHVRYIQHNRCLQVLFSQKCVFVVRARSFEAFPDPPLLPHKNVSEPYHSLACHRFGWLDGVAVAEQKQLPNTADNSSPISILLRAESDDPWSSDVHTLDLYELAREPGHADTALAPEDRAPYRFPPRHAAAFPAARGHLRCTDIRLGPRGTALWIQPRPAHAPGASLGLVALDLHAPGAHPLAGARVVATESLVAAVLPGVLRDRRTQDAVDAEAGARVLMSLDGVGGSWASVDYDEARGLVALGGSTGGVTILKLQ